MSKVRMEALSDGGVAIIIPVMALEILAPLARVPPPPYAGWAAGDGAVGSPRMDFRQS